MILLTGWTHSKAANGSRQFTTALIFEWNQRAWLLLCASGVLNVVFVAMAVGLLMLLCF